jgi:predicted RNA methylase
MENKEESETTEDYLNKDIGILLKTYEDPSRELWQNPDLVVEKLGNLNGKIIADIGVGTGYFTFKMANSAEKVIAIDVENKFLEYIEERKFELRGAPTVRKIETRLCEPDDPLLKPEEADIALIVDTYHFIEKKRVEYMTIVHRGLKEKGVVMLVDYKGGEMPVGPPEQIKVDLDIVLKELKEAGFIVQEIDTTSLQFQYIIKAVK